MNTKKRYSPDNYDYDPSVFKRLNYSLMQVPGYIVGKGSESEKINRYEEDANDYREIYPKKKKQSKKKDNKRSIINRERNPAPNANDFKADWIDERTNIKYQLAHSCTIAKDYENKRDNSIVFWGKIPNLEHEFPDITDSISFTDLHDGSHVGRGLISDILFTRRKLTFTVIVTRLIWKEDAAIYRP